jgi:hypothetical protein
MNNNNKLGNYGPTTCPKIGIKIHESNNDYKQLPVSFKLQNTNINKNVDLNIENYSLDDIYNLFNIKTQLLNEDTMKYAKNIVLQTHPDKSKMDSKFFLFYSSAYKKLYAIYEFQNKSTKKNEYNKNYENTFDDDTNYNVLNTLFEKDKSLKDSSNFNNWFNEKFEKHKVEDSLQSGYGDWLKTNEGITNTTNVSKANMASEFEKQKKRVQSLTIYNGYDGFTSNSLGSTMILSKDNNFTSNGLFSDGLGYTDLRQAYEESVIPVTEDDYKNIPKYINVNDYKNQREQMNVTPLDIIEAKNKLYEQQKSEDQESIYRAFELAKQSEIVAKKNNAFWGEIKKLTNK